MLLWWKTKTRMISVCRVYVFAGIEWSPFESCLQIREPTRDRTSTVVLVAYSRHSGQSLVQTNLLTIGIGNADDKCPAINTDPDRDTHRDRERDRRRDWNCTDSILVLLLLVATMAIGDLVESMRPIWHETHLQVEYGRDNSNNTTTTNIESGQLCVRVAPSWSLGKEFASISLCSPKLSVDRWVETIGLDWIGVQCKRARIHVVWIHLFVAIDLGKQADQLELTAPETKSIRQIEFDLGAVEPPAPMNEAAFIWVPPRRWVWPSRPTKTRRLELVAINKRPEFYPWCILSAS